MRRLPMRLLHAGLRADDASAPRPQSRSERGRHTALSLRQSLPLRRLSGDRGGGAPGGTPAKTKSRQSLPRGRPPYTALGQNRFGHGEVLLARDSYHSSLSRRGGRAVDARLVRLGHRHDVRAYPELPRPRDRVRRTFRGRPAAPDAQKFAATILSAPCRSRASAASP